MKRKIFIGVLLLVGSLLFAGVPAVIQEVYGKVSVKAPGRGWVTARPGTKIAKNYAISTGFNSKAVIKLGESILVVKQLTRMRLSELIEKNGVLHTTLFLRVGKISASVRKAKGLRQDFRVKSPMTTAAVKGTEFEFDGRTLKVFNGIVSFINNLGQKRSVNVGELAVMIGTGLPKTGEELEELIRKNIPDATQILALFESMDPARFQNIINEIQNLTDVTINIVWD